MTLSVYKLILLGFGLTCVSLISSCQTTSSDTPPAVSDKTIYDRSLKSRVGRPLRPEVATIRPTSTQQGVDRGTSFVDRVPRISDDAGFSDSGEGVAPRVRVKELDAFVPALPLSEFIDVVFGQMLEVPYITGPTVAANTAVIQIRSSGRMSGTAFLSLVEGALEEYGVRVTAEDGVFQIVDDKTLRGRIPDFIKSRARLRTRSDLRPVVQFVELQAIDPGSMQVFLLEAFSQKRDQLSIKAATSQGYITLAGLPEDVDAAIAIIRELDELDFAGSDVLKFTPKYWPVADLSQALANALRVEGWEVSTQVGLGRTIALLPVEFSNDLFVFAKTSEAQRRVQTWMSEFDRPIDKGDTTQLFVYQVKNVDASILAEIVNSAVSGQGTLGAVTGAISPAEALTSSGSANATGFQSRDRSPSSQGRSSGPFTVDPIGNRLLFSGTLIEFEKVEALLDTLDTPGPEVLIEVQIAEVTLDETLNFGVEIFDQDILEGNGQLSVSTDGLGLGATGLNVTLLSGDVDLALNALATNRRVKVLSTPILTARSGGVAQIQVGQDIPIITSQRAADSQDGVGNTDILQTVSYRATGVLLAIEPIVFSNNRVDLTISQEVSSQIDAPNSTIASPTISNRSLSTQLSLEDGQTAVLGGLIQESYIRDENGIPVLKDIPVIGNLFSSDGYSVDRTELVILITAYVLRGQDDKNSFVNELSRQIDTSMKNDNRLTTLKPTNF